MKKSILLRAFILMAAVSCSGRPDIEIVSLLCEGLDSPLAIDSTDPHFSWRMESSRAGAAQTAYEIVVASDIKDLSPADADLWASGKVGSGDSQWIPYEGRPLDSRSAAYWKVRVWDENGEVSGWSAPSRFGVGLLHPEDWSAEFIGKNPDEGELVSPLLHKTFDRSRSDGLYLLHVNSLGYHEVYINGARVGDAVLTPAVSQLDKRSQIVTYDVSDYLKEGRNDIVLWIGNGWFREGIPGYVENGPFVRAQLENRDSSGEWLTVLTTDGTWMSAPGGYTSTGTWKPHQFGGEIVDASAVPDNLCAGTLDAMQWKPVSTGEIPPHKAVPQMVQLNALHDELHPVSCTSDGDSAWVYDMGRNFTGWTSVRFPSLAEGQRVRLSYCDFLDDAGRFRDGLYEDYYIASGRKGESFCNKFNYRAYRYIRLSGLAEAPALSDITGRLVRTGYGAGSSFECSDADLNVIHDMVHYTLRCLTLGGYMVDCPQIERLGYGGDGNASLGAAQTMYSLSPLYLNWMQAWADCMREDGGMPHTAPNPYTAGGGPYWCGFLITGSWATYLNYGDGRLLGRFYPQMRKWLEYVAKYSPDGLLRRWLDTGYRGWYLGDWAVPAGVDQMDPRSVDLVNNCYIAVCYRTMSKIASVLGLMDDSRAYAAAYDALARRIQEEFYDAAGKTYSTGSQIDLVYPMLSGVTPPEEVSGVEDTLFRVTEERHRGHLATGLVGIAVLSEWAARTGNAEFMYGMLKERGYPGYLYMIDNGATTTWETWDGDRSRIHNCYNGIGLWFYRALAGINPDESGPGYRKVVISPQTVGGLSWVKASKETPYGRLGVEWKKDGDTFTLNVDIPVGSSAEIVLPFEPAGVVLNGAVTEVSRKLDVGSGRYEIRALFSESV